MNKYTYTKLGIGDWGLGIGELGFGPKPQTPNPKTPTPTQKFFKILILL